MQDGDQQQPGRLAEVDQPPGVASWARIFSGSRRSPSMIAAFSLPARIVRLASRHGLPP